MRWTGSIISAAMAALALAACGSGHSSSKASSAGGQGTPTTAGTGGAQTAYLSKLTGEVQAFDTGSPGGFVLPASRSPAARQKAVYVISCGDQIISCSVPAGVAMQAGQKLGWKMTLVNGNFSPPAFVAGVDAAIAAHASGIDLVAIDCSLVRPELLKAEAAGIKVGAMYSIDCNDGGGTSSNLFQAPLIFNNNPDWATGVAQYEADRMKVIIARTHGNARVIDFNQDALPITKIIRAAGEQQLATCSSCKLVDTVPIGLADTPSVVQQKVQTALQEHPDANAIYPLYDGMTLGGVAAGLQASGMQKKVFLMGADGFAPSMALIRSGVQSAQLGFPADWAAYATIDGLNRLFAGLKPQNSGLGWQLIDKAHNLPATGGWEPPVNFQAAYLKDWGLS